MSGLQVIYFVAVLCVVKAAVTVNIYEEDSNSNEMEYRNDMDNEVEGVKTASLLRKHCRPAICNYHCQSLGYSGGSCRSGHCICNSNDDPHHLKLNELKSCNYQACDQLCRRLGFPGGACVGDRCKCDNFKNELNLQNINELDSCNYQACDQLCRRLGFPGGVCVGDRCKCDNFRNELTPHIINTKAVGFNEVSENNKENEKECSKSVCEDNCQNLGLPAGHCTDGQCICDNYSKVRSLGACDVVACNDMCHRMHYIGGMCRQGSCHCY
ncbi:tenascin-like isoform X1 [Danaus plexippus]|uniref:tenascin-like isoform X1 n=1 Tax=Danaus plexippus TaxID=13037 RepID=UPI002AB11018|nr:tenascin-like isoform X1 [Danaus plexippus]